NQTRECPFLSIESFRCGTLRIQLFTFCIDFSRVCSLSQGRPVPFHPNPSYLSFLIFLDPMSKLNSFKIHFNHIFSFFFILKRKQESISSDYSSFTLRF